MRISNEKRNPYIKFSDKIYILFHIIVEEFNIYILYLLISVSVSYELSFERIGRETGNNDNNSSYGIDILFS